MSKKMLIDAAHPEEVRVAVADHGTVEDFDFETAARKPLRGNIYLARVTRVEPSLQAAFVEYGGNRHGFLAFSEIHPDYYQIPVADREKLQASEAEVADLAAQLELAQRGDDLDDDEGQNGSGAADSSGDHEDAADGDEEDDQPPATLATETPAVLSQPFVEDDGSEQADAIDDVDEEVAPVGEKGDDQDADTDAHESAAQEVEEIGGEDQNAPESLDADSESPDEDTEDGDGDEDEDAVDTASAAAQRAALLEQYREAKRARAKLLRNYKIQEVIKRRQILLVQVVKEERGNKGAALTTYLSLAGRYCVLMPNTARGGGISRKIASSGDRRRLRRVVDSLDVPTGMGLIIRTAGAKRTKTEIKRDYDYLLRLWENIRTLTLESIAPCLIHEEASLIKRAIRDLYDKDISTVLVSGEAGYRDAKDFMKMLMPSHAKNVQPYKDKIPIFMKHDVETQLDAMYQPTVRLKSGGYLVIHQTEALVAIDVNSGRATRERNIEQTALRTNIEAAQETARQCRLRDLAGLIVIDFIDMEDGKNNRKVERALKEALKVDRARIQVGRISSFGLMEMSRQRRRSGLVDGTTHACPTCDGAGVVRSVETAAMRLLRAIEGEAVQGKAGHINVRACMEVCLHILNNHRAWLKSIEETNGVSIEITVDPDKAGDAFDLEKSGAPREVSETVEEAAAEPPSEAATGEQEDDTRDAATDAEDQEKPRKRRRRRRRRKDGGDAVAQLADGEESTETASDGDDETTALSDESQDSDGEARPRRRRGRRGGRRNRRGRQSSENMAETDAGSADSPEEDQAAAADNRTDSDDAAQSDAPEADDAPEPTSGASDQGDLHTNSAAEDAPSAMPDPVSPVAADPIIAKENGANHGQSPGAPIAAPALSTPEPENDAEATEAAPKKPSRKGWWQRAIRS
ncbi:MAG: Rne/Rng family ribonuclease [Pseudomonadota bacterium]